MNTKALAFRGQELAGFAPAVTLGQGLPKQRDGVDCHYFWKEMLRPGRFKRRADDGWDEVTRQRNEKIAKAYKQARAKGYEAPLLLGGHEGYDKSVGWLLDAETKEDGSLWGLHQFLGEEAEVKKLIARNKSSIRTLTNFTDEHGDQYDEQIVHNAILPDPNLSDLEGFKALAASRWRAEAEELTPETKDTTPTPPSSGRSSDMPLKPETLQRAKKILGAVKDDVDADALVLSLCDKAGEFEQQYQAADRDLKQSRREPDPDVLADRADNFDEKVDLLVDKHGMPPEKATELRKLFRPGGKPSGLMLSRRGGERCVMQDVLDLFKDYKPTPESGTGMPPQVKPLEMDRRAGGSEKKETAEEFEKRRRHMLSQTPLGLKVLEDEDRARRAAGYSQASA